MDATPSGWTPLKVIGMVLVLVIMAGFGVCALCGVVMTVDAGFGTGSNADIAWLALGLSSVGAAVAVAMFFAARAILRAARRAPPPP